VGLKEELRGRSQPPAKGPQRERKEVERKFKNHTKLREQKEKQSKSITQTSRKSALRAPREAGYDFYRAIRCLRRVLLKGTRTIF
jgi:hypothetical protein